MDAVHRYEGTVNQVLGDGIMALFGAPLAHEDHAMRACYAALSHAGRRSAGTREELRRAQGLDVQIRVGLNSGEVVVRSIGSDLHMDYTAVGPDDPPRRAHGAARAPGDDADHARARFASPRASSRSTPLGPVPLKGLADPVEVYELVRRAAAAVAPARGRRAGPHAGSSARRSRLEQLRAPSSERATGTARWSPSSASPASGKSRLVLRVRRIRIAPRVGSSSRASPCRTARRRAYLPVIDLLKTYFQIADRDDARTMRAKVTGHVLTLDEALRDTIPALLALLDALPADERVSVPRSARQRGSGRSTPSSGSSCARARCGRCCVVFENLHWIDSETQAFLNSLVDSLPTRRAPAARQLSPRVPARVGQQDVLHAAPPRPAAARERGRAARTRCSATMRQPPVAERGS